MAIIGSLIGSPARALMLTELFDGRALTATELSSIAGVSSATGSEHLALLLDGGMVTRKRSGRHQYYRLASPNIAHALEQLVVEVAIGDGQITPQGKVRTPIQQARLCYDHFAGQLGVQIADGFVSNGFLVPLDSDYELTKKGEAFFSQHGVDVQQLRSSKRLFARQCLDWSERRHHVAGILGTAIAELSFQNKWVARTKQRRTLHLLPKGRQELKSLLGIEFQF